MFAQATAAGFADRFLTPFRASAVRFAKPILYLHADGHQWFVEDGQWESNVVHVQVDRVNATFPPVHVTVTTEPNEPFLFDRRLSNVYEAGAGKEP